MLHIYNRRLADSTNILLILYTLHFVYVAYFAYVVYFAYVAYLQSKVGGLNEDVAQVGKEDQGAPVPERGRPEAPGKFNLTCAVSPPMMITYLSRRTCKSWWTSCRWSCGTSSGRSRRRRRSPPSTWPSSARRRPRRRRRRSAPPWTSTPWPSWGLWGEVEAHSPSIDQPNPENYNWRPTKAGQSILRIKIVTSATKLNRKYEIC